MTSRAMTRLAGVLVLLLWTVPVAAQGVCPYANDGECDEPGIGTSVCEEGTDVADCSTLDQPDGFLYGTLACGGAACRDGWGLAVDEATAASAHSGALKDCGAPSCQLQVTFSRGRCVALAVAPAHGRHAWATRGTIAEANAGAMADCAQDGVTGCSVVAEVCSSR